MKIRNYINKQQTIGTVCLLIMAVIWGWAFVFQKMALNARLSPASLMFSRFFVAACLMGAFAAKQIKANYRPGQWKIGLKLAVLFFAASFIQILGLEKTTPGNNALIITANVVMVPFVCWAVTHKRPPAVLIVCAVVSFSGIAVLSIDTTQQFLISPGDALTLLGALLFAMHLVAVGEAAGEIHFIVLAFTQFVAISIFSFIFLLFEGGGLSGFASKEGIIALIYLGVVATGIGLTLQMFGQKYVPPTMAGILVSTESLLGAIFSVIAGYDKPTLRLLLGGTIMFMSILLANLWPHYHAQKTKAK